ncbi:bacteriocin-like protein [Chryseobacterium sp. 52]
MKKLSKQQLKNINGGSKPGD